MTTGNTHPEMTMPPQLAAIAGDGLPAAAMEWPDFSWPDWVPDRIRAGVEHNFPAGPRDWLLFARTHRAPPFGAKLELDSNEIPDQIAWVSGRYVHYGRSMVGRLVHDWPVGSTSVTRLVAGHVEYAGIPRR
jgi:hypothetical protein